MIGVITRNQEGKITSQVSAYQPSNIIKKFTGAISEDYFVGDNILRRSFREFNDESQLTLMDKNQQAFNSYTLSPSDDPDESWRWNGVRPITRNKVMSIAAHMVASTIYPGVFAQDDADQEDKQAAEIMRKLIEWNIRNSKYEQNFMKAVIAALVNPVAYMEASFAKVYQKIKVKQENGLYTTQQVVDEIMSGFQAKNVPADEILIANAYEPEFQNQRFIIRKRYVDYDTAKQYFGKHPNFKHVQPGVKPLYDAATGMFYDQYDDELKTLCEWVVYYNRLEDTEVSFINGIYMGAENPEHNPIKHRDNLNRPKYPYVKFGYEPIDEGFYFYKALVSKIADDQELIDMMWRMFMDAAFLDLFPPIATTGGEKLDSNIIFPGKVTNFGRDTEVKSIGERNLLAGQMAIQEIEKSMSQSSQSEVREGQLSAGDTTAFEIRRAEINAAIVQYGIFGRMMTGAVKDLGDLMKDDIIHNQTTAEVKEITGELAYMSFLLPNQNVDGEQITDKIVFDKGLIGKKRSKKERTRRSVAMIGEEGGRDAGQRIYKVNPAKFSRMKFMIFMEPDVFPAKSAKQEMLDKIQAYDKMILDPSANQRAVSRDYLYEVFAPGQSDKYMRDEDELPVGAEQMMMKARKPVPVGAEENSIKGVLQR